MEKLENVFFNQFEKIYISVFCLKKIRFNKKTHFLFHHFQEHLENGKVDKMKIVRKTLKM